MHERGYWWVSQGTTFERSLKDSILWAPQTDKRGRAWFYWDNVSKVKAGDIIFHYADGAIRAVSVATSSGQSTGRNLREGGGNGKGWRANIDIHELAEPIEIQSIGPRLVALNIEKGPITRSGGASPGYLYELPAEAVESIVEPMNLAGLPPDLARLLGEWKLNQPRAADLTGLVAAFHTALGAAGLHFPLELAQRFVAALLAKRFVILSGPSGNGKTRLAQAFAHWITTGSDSYRVVAVGADWTNNEAIVGYADRLNGGYAKTEALQLMLHARDHADLPHVLILDEMNLSHVERYFADLLSAIESGEPISLHTHVGEIDGVPPRLHLPPNLFIIGTINVDETTYQFSPKVLDRANVIEFRAGRDELAAALRAAAARAASTALDALAGGGERFGPALVAAANADAPTLSEAEQRQVTAELLLLFESLAATGVEIGFRTAREMMRFVAIYCQLIELPSGPDRLERSGPLAAAIDAQIMQKLLPRLNGSRSQLAPAIWALAALCSHADRPSVTSDGYVEDAGLRALLDRASREEGDDPAALATRTPLRYPTSAGKLARMWQTLDRNGFASFTDS